MSEPEDDEHRADGAPGPERELLDREALGLLDALLNELEEELRTVFVLYELEEMTMAAIAEVLEVPAGTVASRLRRSRARFEELAAAARAHAGEER